MFRLWLGERKKEEGNEGELIQENMKKKCKMIQRIEIGGRRGKQKKK